MLNEKLAAEIRFLYSTGRYSLRDLARRYEVTASAIHQVVHYVTYAEAPEIGPYERMEVIKKEIERQFREINIITRKKY
jgi:predicted DNA-binding protein YlxM (UPF0122 family)